MPLTLSSKLMSKSFNLDDFDGAGSSRHRDHLKTTCVNMHLQCRDSGEEIDIDNSVKHVKEPESPYVRINSNPS